MKITALVEMTRKKVLPPLQKRVLDYIQAHEDEVYSYRDEKLAGDLNLKPSALGFTLWALHKSGLIEKQEAAGKVYFGSKPAIEELRKSLRIPAEDPFERARRNRDRIRQEVGNIDTLKLLDEVREGR